MIPPLDPDPANAEPSPEHEDELIDEAEEESFPASDPPAVPRFD